MGLHLLRFLLLILAAIAGAYYFLGCPGGSFALSRENVSNWILEPAQTGLVFLGWKLPQKTISLLLAFPTSRVYLALWGVSVGICYWWPAVPQLRVNSHPPKKIFSLTSILFPMYQLLGSLPDD